MANFAPVPTVSAVPQGPLTGAGSNLRLRPGQGTIGTAAQQSFPRPPWNPAGGSLASGPLGPAGPNIIDTGGGDGSVDPQTTSAIGGGNNLPTLDALLARQQELAGEKSPMGEMISPWQGVAYAADKFMSGLERGRVDRQETEQRQRLAEIMGGPIGPEQIAQAFAISPEIGVHLLDLQAKDGTQERWDPIPTPQGENGQWFRNQKGDTKKVGGGSTGEAGWKPADMGSLRDDYTKAASIYDNASPTWQAMQDAAKIALADGPNDQNSEGRGAADYNMIVGFAKLLDPNSVVREGEVQSATNLGGKIDMVQSWINSFKANGGKLTPELRRAIMTQGSIRMQGYYDQAKAKRDWISGIATRNNVNPDDVVPPLAAFTPWSDGADDDRKYPG
jgi:hypothetical protein